MKNETFLRLELRMSFDRLSIHSVYFFHSISMDVTIFRIPYLVFVYGLSYARVILIHVILFMKHSRDRFSLLIGCHCL